jgi:hypothetical protein
MICKHFDNGICGVATELADASVFPSQSHCDYCTQKAFPPQDINKVTVSLALSVKPSNREEILARHRHLLVDTDLLKRQQEHWAKLHTTQMDATQFAVWLDGIPKQCDCRKSVDALLKTKPPRFNDWWKWGWEFHNSINRKLNKTEITWDDAAKLWNWETQHQNNGE